MRWERKTAKLDHKGQKQQQGAYDSGGVGDAGPFCVPDVIGVLILEFVIILVEIGVVSGPKSHPDP